MERRLSAAIDPEHAVALMVIYGAGFLAVSLVFALFYRHAWQKRAELELDPLEKHTTIECMQGHLLDAAVASLSIAIALAGSPGWAGWSYFLIGPIRGFHGAIQGRERRELRERIATSATAHAPRVEVEGGA